jgi:hypothetical protein
MKLAFNKHNKVFCCLCGWDETAKNPDDVKGSMEYLEKKLVKHLRFEHNRLPILICRSEKGWDSDGWPKNEYLGPRWQNENARHLQLR